MNFPPIIANNFSLKLVSVVMASLFWLYVVAGRDSEKRLQVPVEIINLAANLTLVEKPPERLEVDLSGSRLALLTVRPESLRLLLDMSEVGEGTVLFTNLENGVRVGSGLRVTRVYPGRIELTVAAKLHQ